MNCPFDKAISHHLSHIISINLTGKKTKLKIWSTSEALFSKMHHVKPQSSWIWKRMKYRSKLGSTPTLTQVESIKCITLPRGSEATFAFGWSHARFFRAVLDNRSRWVEDFPRSVAGLGEAGSSVLVAWAGSVEVDRLQVWHVAEDWLRDFLHRTFTSKLRLGGTIRTICGLSCWVIHGIAYWAETSITILAVGIPRSSVGRIPRSSIGCIPTAVRTCRVGKRGTTVRVARTRSPPPEVTGCRIVWTRAWWDKTCQLIQF